MLTIPYLPKHGGVETVVDLVSTALVARGHNVRIATTQLGEISRPFPILRRPSAWGLVRCVWWADCIVLHGATLRLGWPLLLTFKRAWLVHHIWPREDLGLLHRLARRLLYWRCRHLAVSRALASAIGTQSTVVPNPYDDQQFRRLSGVHRNRDIVFLGRLVYLKGVDDLIDALTILKDRDVRPTTTIIGDGPERPRLDAKVQAAGLAEYVTFTGALPTNDVVRELNRHRVQVVPSRYKEPFGVVALEGAACGCIVVGSAGGGLPDAIGACGETYENGNVHSLANILQRLLYRIAPAAEVVEKHLAPHRPQAVAEAYLRQVAG
jgi:glycogen synthase